jgi:hypothetical protein
MLSDLGDFHLLAEPANVFLDEALAVSFAHQTAV